MYLALYRKWRPKTFEDVIGQPHITVTLKNEISNNRTAHAYLFTGPRGTGKTTCSKILAMAVNCLNPQNGDPCMECENCVGIEQGSTLDVVEIDAASNNGVDNIRQLRDEASYTPAQCKYRVYIIDETHMLSTGAFNALLKIMEEPPSHVLFILATTEAHKVPATILSRCQRFDFRRIKPDDIAKLLLNIADKEESFTLQEDAALIIARLAEGGMRDALSLLDQCVAYSTDVTVDVVTEAAGIVGKSYLYEMTDCILENNASSAVVLTDKLFSMSKDLEGLLEELINHFRNIMLTKTLEQPEMLISVLPDEQLKLSEYAGRISLSALLKGISDMQECMDKMGRSIDKRLNFELCMIKLCSEPTTTTKASVSNSDNSSTSGVLAELAKRLDKLENAFNSGAMISSSKSMTGFKSVAMSSSNIPQVDNSPPPVDLQPMAEWAEILEGIKETDKPLWGVLYGSSAFVNEGFLYISSPLDFAAGMMRQENNAAKLVNAIAVKTGKRYKIRIKSNVIKQDDNSVDVLDDILSKAKSMGVEVNEKE